MDLYQLKTFVTVAREGSITRASEILHLSQPAVSAHIKAIEDTLELALFERTPRGMSLTSEGQRLLAKAEQTLAAHQDLMQEATRIKGRLTGKLRLGVGGNSNQATAARLVTALTERFPEVEVAVKHATSLEVLQGLKNGGFDAGFYNEVGDVEAAMSTVEVSHFGVHVAAPPRRIARAEPLDWKALAELAWIYPTSSACCGKAAEDLFKTHQVRPRRIVSVDREDVTRTLIASGAGLGLLHAETAKEAQRLGEVELILECPTRVRVLFAHLASRAQDPLLAMAAAILREGAQAAGPSAGDDADARSQVNGALARVVGETRGQ